MTMFARAADRVPDLSNAEVLAAQAIDLAVRHNTPPIPRNFEVWYTYASRENADLNASLDRVMQDGGPIEGWWFEHLYEEHLSPRGLNEGVAKISRRIDSEIGGVLGTIQAGMTGTSRAGDALGKVTARIGAARTAEELAKLAADLGEIGRRQLEDARRLGGSLGDARAELGQMQAELEELRNQAFIDHLTQLPNRRRLESDLAKAMAEAQRTGEPLAFALGDIDCFKRVNDTWGHAVGDMVLMKFAQVLKENVKGRDTPARFGGEEFALLLPDTSLDHARVLVEKIRQTFGQRWFVVQETGSEVGRVTVSFGVTRIRPDDSLQSLVERADGFLYAAKENGRDQVWSSE